LLTGVGPIAVGTLCQASANPANWGDPNRATPAGACESYFPTIHVLGDLKVTTGRGQGVLLVDGDFTVAGNFAFPGVRLAPGGRATLSRDLADFLIELSIALHKHAMYPEGHPSLAPAAAAVTRRAAQLLEDRATVSLGVARNQLVIEGVATDPKHPVLRELAGRLHRHHL